MKNVFLCCFLLLFFSPISGFCQPAPDLPKTDREEDFYIEFYAAAPTSEAGEFDFKIKTGLIPLVRAGGMLLLRPPGRFTLSLGVQGFWAFENVVSGPFVFTHPETQEPLISGNFKKSFNCWSPQFGLSWVFYKQ
jgi:hypothetical protein